MKNRKEVIKHSGAVHIQNNITLLQRRAWNVLLANAYDELPAEEEYHIRVRDLTRVLEFSSKNDEYLKEALEALVSCKVKWNVLDKDGTEEWGVTTLLAQAKIRRGLCTYAYSPELRRRLHNPRMYARISLSMQNKFDSKHAQALWEVCLDYLDASRNYGETPFIPLATYRMLMGIGEDMYPLFKLFNQRVIKEPVEEISRVTDFRVAVDYKREQRRVAAVKFKTFRVFQLPGEDRSTLSLFPELEDMPPIVRELKEAGLSAKDAWEVWQDGGEYVNAPDKPEPEAFESYIREKIHLLKARQAAGKVGSITGFLLEAIRRNYANPAYAEEQKQQAARERQRSEALKKRQREQLEEEQNRLEKSRRVDVHQRCERMIGEEPVLAEEAVKALLEEDASFRKLYQPTRTPVENYHKTTFLWSVVDAYLERRYPERFADICEPCDARLAEVAARLAEGEPVPA